MQTIIPQETIDKVRNEILNGKSKLQTAREFGLHYETVKKYTRDIQNGKIYSPEEEKKIREMVKEIGVKTIVARELGVPYAAVKIITQDIKLKPGNRTIGGKTLQLLEEIMNKGYALLENRSITNYRILKKHFPVIQKVHIKGKTIVFLPDRKEEAH